MMLTKLLTVDELNFGLPNLYSILYLLTPNIRLNPNTAKIDIIGCRVRKNAVNITVFIM